MTELPRYFVYTEHVRGESRTWCVADRSGYKLKFVSKDFPREKPARKLCDRMNADWKRYQAARWESDSERERKAAP